VRALCRSLLRWIICAPSIGAGYLLSIALWAGQSPTLDERQGGSQARQIDAIVHGPFQDEIIRMGVAVCAVAIALGAALGWTAAALVALRDRLGAPPWGRSRSWVRRSWLVLALVVVMHGGLELWAMTWHPQLYDGAWYARGGWHRTVQVLATDVLGPTGVRCLLGFACALFIAGPFSRWSLWPARASRAVDTFATHLAELLHRGWERRRTVALQTAAGITVTLFVLAVAQTHLARARSLSDDSRPNVLVLAADSLRADRLDPRITPNLSALAAQGTRFDRAYVSLPRTFPSWVTLLTGRHPHHHGIRSMFPRWEERTRDFDALPERLARAGWATGVVSDYAGDIFSRIGLGFGTVDVPSFNFRQLVRQRALERETPLMPVLDSRWGRMAFPVLREMNHAADPFLLARDAVRTMRALESRGPFFLVVFFSTAHFPYAAPAPYYLRFADPAYRGPFKYFKPVGLGQETTADEPDQRQTRALYDGAVSAIDDAAQSVLDALAADGLANNTIVVVTADHGETLFDHGHGQGHGDHLFGDEGTHVPLAIIDPRRGTPHRDESIVRDVDLAPTLYALTGVSPPADLDGRRLDLALDGRALSPALAYAETELWFTEEIPGLSSDLRLPYPGIARLTEVDTQHHDEVVLQRAMRPLTIVARHRMVRDDRYKLLYVPTRKGVRWMLFDTRDDPGEENDIAEAHPDVVARLQSELWAWMRSDAEMTERGGYLVPRDASARAATSADMGVVRLEGGR
jgi:arylsulfatase A-like enzyme